VTKKKEEKKKRETGLLKKKLKYLNVDIIMNISINTTWQGEASLNHCITAHRCYQSLSTERSHYTVCLSTNICTSDELKIKAYHKK